MPIDDLPPMQGVTMHKTHVYVAGPMRGFPLFNFPAFAKASHALRKMGYKVTSPAEMDLDMGLDPTIANTDAEHDFDVEDALRRDAEVILGVDGIVLLDGWEQSSGARFERYLAETTGKQVWKLRADNELRPRSYWLDKAPEWDGDPRKPEPDVKGDYGSLTADDMRDIEVSSNGHSQPTEAQREHEAQHARYQELLRQEGLKMFPQEQRDRLVTSAMSMIRPNGAAAMGADQVSPPRAPWPNETTNPKDLLGVKKPQLHLVPRSLIIRVAQAMKDGAEKYGPFNWRTKGVRASVYVDAAERHLGQWFDGEEVADDSGVPHLAHAAACIGILIDAEATGNLVDDRPTPGAASKLIKELTEK